MASILLRPAHIYNPNPFLHFYSLGRNTDRGSLKLHWPNNIKAYYSTILWSQGLLSSTPPPFRQLYQPPNCSAINTFPRNLRPYIHLPLTTVTTKDSLVSNLVPFSFSSPTSKVCLSPDIFFWIARYEVGRDLCTLRDCACV